MYSHEHRALILTFSAHIQRALTSQFVLNSVLLYQCFCTRNALKQQRADAEAAAADAAESAAVAAGGGQAHASGGSKEVDKGGGGCKF